MHKRTDAQKYYILDDEMKFLVDAYIEREWLWYNLTNKEKYRIFKTIGCDCFMFGLLLQELKEDIWEAICTHLEKYFILYIIVCAYAMFWFIVYWIYRLVAYLI